MSTHFKKMACAIAGVLALGACGTADMGGSSNIQAKYGDRCNYPVGSKPGADEAMNQYVAVQPGTGKTTKQILETPNNDAAPLDEVLAKLGAEGKTRKDKLRNLRDGRYTDGLAGIPARSFFNAVRQTLNENSEFRTALNVVTTGKLEAYHYVEIGESCLRVLMTKTVTTAGGQSFTFRYRWTIFGEFRVEPRNDNDPTDVFPGADTVKVTKAMADANNFQHKMWSRGNMLKVTRVERSFGNISFFLLPASNRFYKITPDSCIDIMFQDPPDETMPSDAEPPFYCLGRCEDPPIVNTK